jgi:hypothetical protein
MSDGRTHYESCWQSHHDCAIAEVERLAEALREAASSLEAIARLAGRDEYMRDTIQISGYAYSRAKVARAALAATAEPDSTSSVKSAGHPVGCSSCDAVVFLPFTGKDAHGRDLISLIPLTGWERTADTPWLCPKCATAARPADTNTEGL